MLSKKIKHNYYFLQNSGRVDSIDVHGLPSTTGEDKESDVLYDMLLDDFDEEDDTEGSR